MVNRTGNFVQSRVPASDTLKSRSLSIESVYRQRGDVVVGDEGLFHRERSEVEPRSRREFEQRAREDAVDVLGRLGMGPSSTERFYRITDEATYFVEFSESQVVPDGHVGVVRPRETLRRSGALLQTAFVDPGQETIEAAVSVDDQFVLLAEDTTVAELVVVRTEG